MVDLNSLVSGLGQLKNALGNDKAENREQQGGALDLTKLAAMVSSSDIAQKAPQVMTMLQEILAKFGKGDIKELVQKACALISKSDLGATGAELTKTLQGLLGKKD